MSALPDETMAKFKGRLSFRQYLPSKPTKWGVKIWSLCESTTGYTWAFQVYTGRTAGHQEHGLSHRVVVDLTADLQGSHVSVHGQFLHRGAIDGVFAGTRDPCLWDCAR